MHAVLLSAKSSCDENERQQQKTFVLGPNHLCYHFCRTSAELMRRTPPRPQTDVQNASVELPDLVL